VWRAEVNDLNTSAALDWRTSQQLDREFRYRCPALSMGCNRTGLNCRPVLQRADQPHSRVRPRSDESASQGVASLKLREPGHNPIFLKREEHSHSCGWRDCGL
jgi:hypothetical protein